MCFYCRQHTQSLSPGDVSFGLTVHPVITILNNVDNHLRRTLPLAVEKVTMSQNSLVHVGRPEGLALVAGRGKRPAVLPHLMLHT